MDGTRKASKEPSGRQTTLSFSGSGLWAPLALHRSSILWGSALSLFTWLFGDKGPAATAGAKQPKRAVELDAFDGRFVQIASRDFFGQFSRSPNGRFQIVWREEPWINGRKPGKGAWLLLDREQVCAEGRAERPNDGKVADNGTVILNDWLLATGELSGTFLALRADGSLILSRRFTANLFNNGLSPDGRYAVCQTCNSSTEDSSRLTIFDLGAGVELGSRIPESGWAQSYEFSVDGRTLRLKYHDGDSFAYSLRGNFIDRETWIQRSLAKGDLYLISQLLHSYSNAPPSEFASRLLAGIENGLGSQRRDDPRARAWALKLRGLCLEAMSESREALTSYDEALSLDPKVGVKRRAERLRGDLRRQ